MILSIYNSLYLNRKIVYLKNHQTFLKSDLEEAINYECEQWEKLRKLYPHIKEQLILPFDPQNAYWPDLEISRAKRGYILSNLLVSPKPNQDSSQFHLLPIIEHIDYSMSRMNDMSIEIDDSEVEILENIENIRKKYMDTLDSMVNKGSLKASNMEDSLGTVITNSISRWGSSQDTHEKLKNDMLGTFNIEEKHWVFVYCVPYITSSIILYFLYHIFI